MGSKLHSNSWDHSVCHTIYFNALAQITYHLPVGVLCYFCLWFGKSALLLYATSRLQCVTVALPEVFFCLFFNPFEPTYEIMAPIALRRLNLQTRMRSHPRLIFGQTLRLLLYFMCANSEGFGKTAQMRSLAWAFAVHLCDKYHNLMSWLICRFTFAFVDSLYLFDGWCQYLAMSLRMWWIHPWLALDSL